MMLRPMRMPTRVLLAGSAFLVLAVAAGLASSPASFLTRPESDEKAPPANGFLQRWLILEPIRVSGQLTDSAVQAAVIWYGAIEVGDLSLAHYITAAKIIPPILIANGDADTSVPAVQAIRLNDELLEKGAKSTLTILSGAGHEDPAFMATQMLPTFKFLDSAFGR